jgi:hypothetical protein
MASHALPLYALRAATSEMAVKPFQRVICGRLTTPLDTPCHAGLIPIDFPADPDSRRRAAARHPMFPWQPAVRRHQRRASAAAAPRPPGLVCSFFCSFVPWFLCSFLRSFSFSRSSVCSFIRSFVHSFIRSFVHSFIRSFVHLRISEMRIFCDIQIGELLRLKLSRLKLNFSSPLPLPLQVSQAPQQLILSQPQMLTSASKAPPGVVVVRAQAPGSVAVPLTLPGPAVQVNAEIMSCLKQLLTHNNF